MPKICLLCLIVLLPLSAIAAAFILHDPPAPQILSPSAGESIRSELSSGETQSYSFRISQQSFLRIDFYSPNIDLLVTMVLPGDSEPLQWHIIKRGKAPIASVFDAPGTCRLEVQSPGKNVHPGSYQMEIREFRPAGAQDTVLAAACTHLSKAAHYRRQWTETMLQSAIREYGEALRIWKDTGDVEQEAVTLKNTGDVWEIFAEWDKALSIYEKARAVYRRLGDTPGEIEVLNAISVLCINRGEYRKALDIYSPGARTPEDPWQMAQMRRNFGAAFWGMTELKKAEDFLNQALGMQRQLRDLEAQADTLLYLGYVHFAVKDLYAAEQNFQKSRDLFEEVGNPRGAALALTALGLLSAISGEKQEALKYYNQSLKIFEIIGELSGRYMVLTGKAHVYLDLGKNDDALQNFQTSLSLVKRAGDRALEADISNYIGAIYRDLGDYGNALEYSRQAVAINESLPSPQAQAYALLNLAKTQDVLGKQDAALESCTQGLELSKKAGDRFLEGHFLNALGQLHRRAGRLEEALDCYRRALSMQRESNDSVSTPGTLYNLACAERDAGDLEQAKKHAEEGLEVTESLRGKVASPELRGSFLASVYQRYELTIDLLMQLHEQQKFVQLNAEALRISEQARARSLLDMLAEAQTDIREGVASDLLDLERSLRKELNTKAEMQMQLFKRKHSAEEEVSLAGEIDRTVAEYQEAQARIRSESPHYAGLTQPSILNLRGIQQLIDAETLLLEYELGDERSYLWAVTPTELESHVLPKRAEIGRRVRRVLDLMLERQKQVEETNEQYQQRIRKADLEYREEAAALSRILLGPVANRLGSRRLLVVPEGILHHLPFAALPEPAPAGIDATEDFTYLIAGHEIIHLPSASVLGIIRRETEERALPPKRVAVLADPVFQADDPRVPAKATPGKQSTAAAPEPGKDSPALLQRAVRESDREFLRLPGTLDEAESIMALVPEGSGREFLGFEANLEVASGPELGQYQTVHFATHGFIDDDNPELSGLVLSLFNKQGRKQEGYLRLHDIYNLQLPVELVVLSACESAQGNEIRGEGLVGIVRGFMYAGAKRIMASLWKVDDRPTAELMERFYRHLLQGGETPARALQMAQLEMLEQQRRRAPYYWAAFILQGEYK